MDNEPTPNPVWFEKFDERQQQQIRFSRLYAREFHHGANGHNDMMIIAKMAELMDEMERQIKGLEEDI